MHENGAGPCSEETFCQQPRKRWSRPLRISSGAPPGTGLDRFSPAVSGCPRRRPLSDVRLRTDDGKANEHLAKQRTFLLLGDDGLPRSEREPGDQASNESSLNVHFKAQCGGDRRPPGDHVWARDPTSVWNRPVAMSCRERKGALHAAFFQSGLGTFFQALLFPEMG